MEKSCSEILEKSCSEIVDLNTDKVGESIISTCACGLRPIAKVRLQPTIKGNPNFGVPKLTEQPTMIHRIKCFGEITVDRVNL